MDRHPSLAEGHSMGHRLFAVPSPSAYLRCPELEAIQIRILSPPCRLRRILYFRCPWQLMNCWVRRHSSFQDTVSFKYDPFGRRIYKSSSSGTSIYAYDGDNLVEETNSSGTAVARYSQGPNIDEPLAMLRGAITSYYHADGLGSVTSLSNPSGVSAQTYGYDSFGKQTSSSGSLTNPFQYTGRESDTETGLYYYRARYYDPAAGRFLGEDPLSYSRQLATLKTTYMTARHRLFRSIRTASGASSPGVNTVGQSFAANPGQIALSQFNGSAIFLSGDWGSGLLTGIFSPYANSNGSATSYGLGVLTHELLHKKSAGGGFSHPDMNAALDAVGAQGNTLGRNDIADRIARLCFQGGKK
jgi:RHS repeat-associated protein